MDILVRIKRLVVAWLTLVFDNGEQGTLDMKPYWNFGVFQAIRDYDQFKRVRVAFDTIQWDGGLNLDPEFVYAECKTISHT